MEAQISRPVNEYKTAFMLFTDTVEDEVRFRTDGIVLAQLQGTTFRISHYNDLIWEIKTYFKNDYSLIYTDTPFELWAILYDEHPEINQENLIIDIYKAWKLYWEQRGPKFVSENTMQFSKQQSWEEFSKLVVQIQSGPGNIIENAIEISDFNLIPILALALRMQFKDENDFYKSCIDIMTEELYEVFGIDGEFDEIEMEIDGEIQRYFIYIPECDFNDNLLLLE
ncbi:hypothetical protein SAMN05192574_103559 [Mucilaginibacter gossypiicola]|uniref:Uncharacterized protein n=1 Tax=Mucilaginibacter gossypiicola TaxID=551995 RepID=A0A1H8HLW2_9SPHI|nr:hypothetical protein [Mucilaginibacter gossypiicola]SEN57232.1 hypothetical protein SAMN05192574_103559 [Mucilaginibacter gossypiicola]